MCAGYLYGAAAAASRLDDEAMLEMTTLLTNTAFVLARDSGESEEELRALIEYGILAGNETPTTEAGWDDKQWTIDTCITAARGIRDQLGQ